MVDNRNITIEDRNPIPLYFLYVILNAVAVIKVKPGLQYVYW